MSILSQDQIKKIVSLYDYYEEEDVFVEKVLKYFSLTENEIRTIFRLLDLAFIKWS